MLGSSCPGLIPTNIGLEIRNFCTISGFRYGWGPFGIKNGVARATIIPVLDSGGRRGIGTEMVNFK